MSTIIVCTPRNPQILEREIREIFFAHPDYPDPTPESFSVFSLFVGKSDSRVLSARQMEQQISALHAGFRAKYPDDKRLHDAVNAYDAALAAAWPEEIDSAMNDYARRLFIESRIKHNSNDEEILAVRHEYDLQVAARVIAEIEEEGEQRTKREFNAGLAQLVAEDREAVKMKLLNDLIDALDATSPEPAPVVEPALFNDFVAFARKSHDGVKPAKADSCEAIDLVQAANVLANDAKSTLAIDMLSVVPHDAAFDGLDAWTAMHAAVDSYRALAPRSEAVTRSLIVFNSLLAKASVEVQLEAMQILARVVFGNTPPDEPSEAKSEVVNPVSAMATVTPAAHEAATQSMAEINESESVAIVQAAFDLAKAAQSDLASDMKRQLPEGATGNDDDACLAMFDAVSEYRIATKTEELTRALKFFDRTWDKASDDARTESMFRLAEIVFGNEDESDNAIVDFIAGTELNADELERAIQRSYESYKPSSNPTPPGAL